MINRKNPLYFSHVEDQQECFLNYSQSARHIPVIENNQNTDCLTATKEEIELLHVHFHGV